MKLIDMGKASKEREEWEIERSASYRHSALHGRRLFVRIVPFGEDAEDPYEIYEEIIKKPILYPSFFKDRKARKVVDQLVNKVPEIRLGGSYASLKGNPWFD